MRGLVSKFIQRSTLMVASFVLAVSSLSTAMPLFLSQSANAAPATIVCTGGCDSTQINNAITLATSGDTLSLDGDISLTSSIKVTKTLTIIGNGHDINASFAKTDSNNNAAINLSNINNVIISNVNVNGIGDTDLHGINSFKGSLSLNNVTLNDFSRYGLVVNGSNVTVNNITTSNNGWGGIDVDQSSTSNPSQLTINGVSHHSELNQVFIDDSTKNVSITDTNSQYQIAAFGDARLYTLKTPPAAPLNLGFTQGSNSLACGAIVGSSGIYSTHLNWTMPSGETTNLWKVTPTYPSGSHGTPYTWTSGTDVWIGANIGQGYGAAPNDQGTYSYSVQYKGTNGLWSQPAVCDLVYDTKAPVVSVVPTAGSLLHGTETFNITVTDNNVKPTDTVWVYLYNHAAPYKSWGASVVLANGHGTFTVNTNLLNDGLSSLDVQRLYDLAGNASGIGDTYFHNYVIDNTGPTAPVITSPVNEQWFKNSPILNTWDASNDPSGIANYQIQYIYGDGHTFAGDLCDGVNACRSVPGTQLFRNHQPGLGEEGAVTIKVRAIDTLGNIGPWSSSVKYYYDHTAPIASIDVSPVKNGNYITKTVTITGSVDASELGMKSHWFEITGPNGYSITNATGLNKGGDSYSITWNTAGLASGSYTIRYVATDLAGNRNDDPNYQNSTTKTVIVDNQGPSANFTSTIPAYINGNFSVAGVGSDNIGLKSIIFDIRDVNGWVAGCIGGSSTLNYTNGTKNADTSCVMNTANLVSGQAYTLRIHASDFAGYGGGESRQIIFDNTNPTASLTATPSTAGGTSNTVTITGDASDANVASYQLTIGSYDSTVVTHTTSGAITPYDWDVTGLASGVYTATLVVTDMAGNSTTTTTDITVDNNGPAATITTSGTQATATPTLEGTVDGDATSLELSIDGVPQTLTWVPGDITWSFTTPTLSDGSHTVQILASDALGNTGGQNGNITISVPVTLLAATPGAPAPTPQATVTPGEVLGDQTTTPSDTNTDANVVKTADKTGSVLGSSTDNSMNIFGLAWYWWLAILAAIVAIWWFIAAALRRRDQQSL